MIAANLHVNFLPQVVLLLFIETEQNGFRQVVKENGLYGPISVYFCQSVNDPNCKSFLMTYFDEYFPNASSKISRCLSPLFMFSTARFFKRGTSYSKECQSKVDIIPNCGTYKVCESVD